MGFRPTLMEMTMTQMAIHMRGMAYSNYSNYSKFTKGTRGEDWQFRLLECLPLQTRVKDLIGPKAILLSSVARMKAETQN